jgi:hypothetical protein
MAIPKTNCNMNTAILAVITILIIAFTSDIFNAVPVLKKLFTDNLNFLLLILLSILIIFLDIPSGIIVAFLVIYLSVYINNSKPILRQNFADIAVTEPSIDKVLGDSEFLYEHNKLPVVNLSPFMPKTDEEIRNASQPNNMPCDVPRVIVPVANPNRDGYDVAGCRYDYQDTDQNLFMNGPPLSKCSTYSGEQFQKVGTLFYPLNG